MADKKISALTGATTPLAGTEVLPIVQGGATVKVAVSDLTAGRAVAASSVNKVVITAPATSSTLTIADGKTLAVNDNATLGTGGLTLGNSGGFTAAASKVLTASNTLTLAGTDATTQTFPTTSATIARTDAAQTFTGDQTFTGIQITQSLVTGGRINIDACYDVVNWGTSSTCTASINNWQSYGILIIGVELVGLRGNAVTYLYGSVKHLVKFNTAIDADVALYADIVSNCTIAFSISGSSILVTATNTSGIVANTFSMRVSVLVNRDAGISFSNT